MKITPTTLSLQQFFAVGNEQFLIPAYQRRYAWGQRQQRELFDDLRLLPPGDTHLLGTVLFLSDTHRPGINQLELVDGQQRVTTITVLMQVLARRFDREGDADTAQELTKLLQCKGVDRKAQAKLQLGDLDHEDYLRVMEGGDTSEMENECLRSVHEHFTKWVDALSVDQLNEFLHKLLNSASIIRLDVGAAKDAYKLFETINNRGLRLKPTDIIKNFLLGHASSLSDGTLGKVKDDWRKLIVALDGLDSDDFFRHWLAGKLHRKVTKTKLVADFKSYYLRHVQEAESMTEFMSSTIKDDEDEEDYEDVAITGDEDEVTETSTRIKKVKLTAFAKALRQSAELYSGLLWCTTRSTKVNRHIENLWRIKAFQAFTWLLDMFGRESLDEKAQLRLLRALEAFMMRRHICEKRSNELETIFAGLTGIANEGYERAVLEVLRDHTPDDDEFESAFASFPFVPAVIDRARYALEMFEYKAIGHKNEYYLAEPDDLELEHIIPKAADKASTKKDFGDWPSYLGEGWKVKHTKMLHRIGNMTLLADELNVVASNNPFLAKRKEYAKSNIQLTKDLVCLPQFKFKQVEDRSKTFAKQAVTVWKV
ncbi:DUF262 domain-containing HNH endonuclease family protein [Comamonas thiooxydans]|uniref:DUF262 domain-containing protein n=1 Tax=Comamonas thiooxydans TaxID=363952 RepID=UPI00244A8723|nr:DUF262 domain-containing HNH endonuclease family protein [Comamonas thiooxydans]MDH1475219.1 DUF262 domain-containing HNH endonuclease family protein [Comamonas thiooxydans]